MTLKEIALAINEQLIRAVPEIPITSKDIREGIERPSFFVDFDPSRVQRNTARMLERTITVTIFFFPTDRYKYKLEMLDVQQRLEDAFNDELVIDSDTRLYTGEITSQKVDGVLQFSFDIAFTAIEPANDDDIPMMEELIFKG